MARWFKHISGVLVLGVELPDGSTATVPAAVTDVFGTVAVQEQALVLDADGLRSLRALAGRLLESAQDRPAGADR
jgi:NAD(P)H-hydrate repair Nnr-like enzyme with NAD(P)H-hydrate dehydratase domain